MIRRNTETHWRCPPAKKPNSKVGLGLLVAGGDHIDHLALFFQRGNAILYGLLVAILAVVLERSRLLNRKTLTVFNPELHNEFFGRHRLRRPLHATTTSML